MMTNMNPIRQLAPSLLAACLLLATLTGCQRTDVTA